MRDILDRLRAHHLTDSGPLKAAIDEIESLRSQLDRISQRAIVYDQAHAVLEREVYQLESKLSVYRQALKSIANTDYRCNRSSEAVIAYRALNREEEGSDD